MTIEPARMPSHESLFMSRLPVWGQLEAAILPRDELGQYLNEPSDMFAG